MQQFGTKTALVTIDQERTISTTPIRVFGILLSSSDGTSNDEFIITDKDGTVLFNCITEGVTNINIPFIADNGLKISSVGNFSYNRAIVVYTHSGS